MDECRVPSVHEREDLDPESPLEEQLRRIQSLLSDDGRMAALRQRAHAGAAVTEHQPLPITRPLPRLDQAATDEGLKRNARSVYRASVSYHATDPDSKQDIQRSGFQLGRKNKGATERSGFPDPDSPSYHYLIPSRDQALAFDARHLTGHAPTLVRVLGAGHAFPIESDPNSTELYEGFRTSLDIGSHLVLRSKRSPAAEDAEGFRQQLSQAGVQVDRDRAGELLREVQSDSEDDLPDDLYD